jgi:hypothetical protein
MVVRPRRQGFKPWVGVTIFLGTSGSSPRCLRASLSASIGPVETVGGRWQTLVASPSGVNIPLVDCQTPTPWIESFS